MFITRWSCENLLKISGNLSVVVAFFIHLCNVARNFLKHNVCPGLISCWCFVFVDTKNGFIVCNHSFLFNVIRQLEIPLRSSQYVVSVVLYMYITRICAQTQIVEITSPISIGVCSKIRVLHK